jgi:hypothetical protein
MRRGFSSYRPAIMPRGSGCMSGAGKRDNSRGSFETMGRFGRVMTIYQARQFSSTLIRAWVTLSTSPGICPCSVQENCRVLFEVHKPLVPLFHDYDVEVIARGEAPPSAEALPPFDFHCPLFSLPLVFKTTLDTIPSSVPYLTAQLDKVDAWGALLGEKARPRVGLTWSGNPKLRHDFRRSISLETLTPMLTDAVEWFSLQPNVRDHDRETLAATSALRDLTDRLTDFSDTAALISHMDVVISVDTSVAHLSGALGKPLWLLLPFHPDFRWLRERSDSPWYPTATLFRQTRDGDWSDVLARMAQRLLNWNRYGSRSV